MVKTIGHIVHEQIMRSQMARSAAARLEKRDLAESRSILTISRQYGSGGSEIARIVAERLGWSLWDRELVEAIAQDAGVRTSVVEHFDERTVSELEALAHSLAGDHEVGNFLYRRHLAHALLAIRRIGHAVIVGRGAQYILRDSLSVRIIASFDHRIKTLMARGIGRKQAEEEIRRSDHERAEFIRRTFDRDIDDLEYYDLVLRTDRFGLEGAADIVVSAVRAYKQ